MILNMNNSIVETLINDCQDELDKISLLIDVLGNTNRAVPFLTKYALIRTCGTLEQSFKTIISDFSTTNQSSQVRNYIDFTFRESSMNPSIDNICSSLKKFDENWRDSFKGLLNGDVNAGRIKQSINSLNNSRNIFAHGRDPQITFNDVERYFIDAKIIIGYIDDSVR